MKEVLENLGSLVVEPKSSDSDLGEFDFDLNWPGKGKEKFPVPPQSSIFLPSRDLIKKIIRAIAYYNKCDKVDLLARFGIVKFKQ